MKRLLLFAGFLLAVLNVSGQDSVRVKTLMMEGIRLHDQGRYADAIKKYDEVLTADPANIVARYEKAYSLMASKKYEEAIALSREIIENKQADTRMVGNAYSTWGSALDEQGEHKKALKIYNEGIKRVPAYNMLNYNKAITYLRMNDTDAGILELEESISKNPGHRSSHFMLGRVMLLKSNKIAALLPYMTYLLLDNKTKRAEDALGVVRGLVEGGVKKTDSGSYHIPVSLGALKKTGKKPSADTDFESMELLFELGAATAFSKTKDMLPADRFASRLVSFIGQLAAQKGHNGFYGKFYLPFFNGLHEQQLAESFAHHIFSPSGNVMNEVWIQDHRQQMERLGAWTQAYHWPGSGVYNSTDVNAAN
ncbi:tetratricopeptide repeat protein [Niabella aurantiaca]|uniref:tetratricopeptide repeat protein n=1 Tax=Niabella aurantiaca TaxID=379900 RepID=UPI0003633ED8|nr:tetratricopeptide repeat protein [Niabella aurantiaca]